MRHGAQVSEETDEDGSGRVLVSGFGLPVNAAIAMSVLAIDIPFRLLAGWNGVNASGLHVAAGAIMQRAGIGV
jgi:hypothetical protein